MPRNFIKNIIFSRTPLKSCYRFGDKFQIYPVNLANAPSSTHAMHFPMIIEFYVDDSEIKEVKEFDTKSVNQTVAELTAQTNKLIQLTNLISTISNYRLFFYRHIEMMWSVPVPEELTEEVNKEFNKISSSTSMPSFTYENISKDMYITEFSNPDFPKIELLNQRLYYFYEPLEGKKKSINFPNTVDVIFENYFNLDFNELKIINSAMHQFCNGLDLFKNMKSLSFFSIVV
jgi:hypothetical protein